jgi:DNA helicase-2/ATP-dependent DNA helicase PcrA
MAPRKWGGIGGDTQSGRRGTKKTLGEVLDVAPQRFPLRFPAPDIRSLEEGNDVADVVAEDAGRGMGVRLHLTVWPCLATASLARLARPRRSLAHLGSAYELAGRNEVPPELTRMLSAEYDRSGLLEGRIAWGFSFETLGDGLVDPALRIAGTEASPLRVTAGPGTGKTFCLMRRVARILEAGAAPKEIFVCTFTRTAARSLKDDLEKLGAPGSDKVRTSTLHSYCFSLLGQADVLELTGRVPRPLLQAEERFLLEDLKYRGLGGIRLLKKAVKAFNAAWARLQSTDPGGPISAEDQLIHAQLLGWLTFHEAMLIGELVPEALKFLRANPESEHRPHFKHVLGDEYQDLNRAEQELLDDISQGGTLTVIGDEDQSIYSFKYAHPEGIATFPQTHPACTDEELMECRRCPRIVVQMANSLISANVNRTQRALSTREENPEGEIHIVQWVDMATEAAGIAQFVRHMINGNRVESGQILILAPRRQFGYAIRNALNSAGVPAHSFFQEEALDGDPTGESCEAQKAFALLTLLANPEDRVALRCWCGFGSPSLRAGAWDKVRKYCEGIGASPRHVLQQLAAGELSLPYVAPLLAPFSELLSLEGQMEACNGHSLVDAIFPEGKAWAEPFRAVAMQLDGDFPPEDLYELQLSNLAQPELPVDVDYVRVMSLHKSKGLTADLVVIAGCLEGLIPTYDADHTLAEAARHLEEQRRVFYVALTRARKTLVISSVTKLKLDAAFKMGAKISGRQGGTCRAIASRFLSELGPAAPAAIRGKDFLAGLN